MTLLISLKCNLGTCRPRRGSHRWEPENYRHVSVCKHCEKQLVRTGSQKWEKLGPKSAEQGISRKMSQKLSKDD